VFGAVPGAQAYVTGDAAYALDSTRIFTDGTPLVLAFVLGLSFLLLLVAFRSIVIPTTAIALNLLSTAAAYGILTLVFQDGWFAEAIGITPGPVIESFVPLFVFTIVYGLSMDYHFFILTRIKEARDRGLDSKSAVAHGISVTAGTITSAAAIMVVVFSVFVTMKFTMIQQLGLGLAVAVFVDATVIRSILLPAVMRLLGDWNLAGTFRLRAMAPRGSSRSDRLRPGRCGACRGPQGASARSGRGGLTAPRTASRR
jgi:RND superfamily putative drug exporter